MTTRKFAVWLAFLLTSAVGTSAYADQSGMLIQKGPNNRYNYVPSVIMLADGTQKMWWCAGGASSDVILYRSINANTQQIITDTTQVLAEGVSGSWDSVFVCDPSVIMGDFTYPDGSGVHYSYLMYYTGTDNSTNGGIDNGVGVAYSNDGVTWRKWPFPILRTSSTEYGIGEQSAISADGKSAVWLFVLQKLDSSPQHYHLYYSTDGVHLQYKFQVSESGVIGNFITEADFAFDYNGGNVYMVTNRINDEATMDVYQMPWTSLSNGTWQHFASLGANGTYKPTPASYKYNGGAGFLRNEFGNNSTWLPMIEVFFGAGMVIDQTDMWWWQTTGN
ncbi:hypothetical protein [Burkholderia cenocepacia]|uniref:hypothetical protein n=1 Tax=Burkholderia cenocepacia TaxID=95486 RepID=UPI0028750A84|nr:hypothetical protein [Burkholderia cenocepacia]MDS0849239.1 hypothetical protein [Burkholderia cenocepacia]